MPGSAPHTSATRDHRRRAARSFAIVEELVGGGGEPELQQAGGGVDAETGRGERAQVGHPGAEQVAQLLRVRPARDVHRQPVDDQRAHQRELPRRAEGERDDGLDLRARAGAGPDPDRVEAQRAAQLGRADACGPEVQVRLRRGRTHVGVGRLENDRREVEQHAVEHRREVRDRGPGPADGEPDRRGTVREVGEDRLVRGGRVRFGVPGTDVPAVGHRAARGCRPARTAAARARRRPPGRRHRPRCRAAAPRHRPGWSRSAPRPRPRAARRRRAASPCAARRPRPRPRPPGPVRARRGGRAPPVRRVRCGRARPRRPCRHRRPAWCSCASTPARPAAGAGPAGGRRPRLPKARWGGVYAGGAITGAGRDAGHSRLSPPARPVTPLARQRKRAGARRRDRGTSSASGVRRPDARAVGALCAGSVAVTPRSRRHTPGRAGARRGAPARVLGRV